jgi:hypothetical protein
VITAAQELDNLEARQFPATFVAGSGFVADMTPVNAADQLQDQLISWVAVQVVSSNSEAYFTNLDIKLEYGDDLAAAGLGLGGQFTYLSKGSGGLQGFWLIAPILIQETGSQRTRLYRQQLKFTAGAPAVQGGIRVTVNIPNNANFTVTAFTLSRQFAATNGYATAIGAL